MAFRDPTRTETAHIEASAAKCLNLSMQAIIALRFAYSGMNIA